MKPSIATPGISFIKAYTQNRDREWRTALPTQRLRSLKNKFDGRMCVQGNKGYWGHPR